MGFLTCSYASAGEAPHLFAVWPPPVALFSQPQFTFIYT